MARENLLTWDRMCDDFVQEETRRGLLLMLLPIHLDWLPSTRKILRLGGLS